MGNTEYKAIGKRAMASLLAFGMSFMMVPATAFAEIGGKTYEVEVDASQADASHKTGEDVNATYNPAVGVLADNGHSAEVEVGDVTMTSGFNSAVMVEADNDGTANVVMGDVTGRLKWGSNGIDVKTKGGDVDLVAGDIKACKVGVNIDNAPTATLSDYSGNKHVIINSITQVEDSRYSNAGINVFSYTLGDVNDVYIIGDISAEGSRGIDMLARGGSESSIQVGGIVNANYLGVKVTAGSLGNINGIPVSTGTANLLLNGVVSKNWDKAVEIDSESKGSLVNFYSTGDIEALAPDSAGLFVRSVGGKSVVGIDGDLSGTNAGLRIYCDEIGSNDVLVTGTITGKNGVDISYDSITNDTLTVWRIEKGSDGQYFSSEWNNVPSDDREIFAKKNVNYIVFVENLLEGVTLSAFKADGSDLNTSHDYDVAREGDKIIVKVDLDPGCQLKGVYNGWSELIPLEKDANGNYYIVVPRGGGIYLSAALEGDGEGLVVIPTLRSFMPDEAAETLDPVTETTAKRSSRAATPLLVYDGVEINDLEIKMDGATPVMRTMLSNTNKNDVKFDCEKFKVVRAGDESEVAFKTEAKELKSNEKNVKCEFKADENTMQAGDRANVFYDGKLLGTFTVK